MVQHTEKFDNLLAYFERAIDQIVITVNNSGETVAWVPSTSSNDPYTVWIDESSKVPYATKCTCNDHWYRKSYCKHMQCADLYFQHIAAIFAHDEQEVAESVVEQPAVIEPVYVNHLATYDILAVADEVRTNAFLSGVYEELALTKTTAEQRRKEQADHCPHCGKLCKGDICGYCVQ